MVRTAQRSADHQRPTVPGPERTARESVGSSHGATSTAAGGSRPTDAELYAGVVERRHEAFAELYERYFHELYDFAARITHDRAIAADIVQGVFATVWEHAGRGGEVRSPKAWLYRLTHNAAIDELRRRRRTVVAGEDESFDFAALEDRDADEPMQALVDKELAELVWSTAARMRPEEYGLLDLYVRRELSPDELAEQLGISPGAAHTRLSRLRRSFEDALTVTLLKRRGSEDCEALGALVAELGDDAESEAGWRQLRDHIRACPNCRSSRRRYVTASKILAGLAPVPLTPHLQGAIWASLCKLLGLGGAAGAAGASAAAHAAAAAPAETGHLSSLFGAARANPVVTAAAAVTAVAVGIGAWAAVSTLRSSPTPGAVRDPTRFSVRPSGESRIAISWTRLPDAVGYSILWSHGPKDEPDTVADLPGSATRTKSAPLAPGTWYFHLRTHGHGAWTDTVHLGPFRIAPPPSDTGRPRRQPSAPSGRASTTPETGPRGEGAAPTPAAAPVVDSTPPSGQTAALADGPYYRSLSVRLVLTRGSDHGSGLDPRSGVVERSDAPLARGSCGRWGAWSRVTLHHSADTTVADAHCYRYRYRISDRAGNQSAPSPPTTAAMIDTTPPAAPAPTLTEDGPDTAASGSTLFYRPTGSGGTFTVSASSGDAGSGLAAIEFPALKGGMEGPARTRRTAPYEVVYAWKRGAVAAGPETVTAYDRAGNRSRAVFTLAPDRTGPEGLSVELARRAWRTETSVPLVVGRGFDAGSGLSAGSLLVERAAAPLSRGQCGSFGSTWSTVTLSGGADTSVADGACYRYRVTASDEVGNRTTSQMSEAARIDTTAPVLPRLALRESGAAVHVSGNTVFYRPSTAGSLIVSAASDDPQSGIARVSFPPLPGASGGGEDTRAPYGTGYSWSALDANGAQTVTTTNGAGLAARAAFVLTPDAEGPTGVSVAATASGAEVAVTVDEGSDLASGVDTASPVVERDEARPGDLGCGSFAGLWTPVTLAEGKDASVVTGTCYRYRVTVADHVGNTTTSAPSSAVVVDASPPAAPTLTLEALSGTYASGSTVFYRLVGGSFAVAATSSDPDSGIAEIVFPTLPGAAGGGSATTAPYRTIYAWTTLAAPWWPPTAAVSATNHAGLTASSSFTLSNDESGPSVTVTVTREGQSGHIRVEIQASDAGSGVSATDPLVERDSASRHGDDCGSFSGTWTQVTLDADGVDQTALSNTCYRYRATVSDNVGNTGRSPPVDAG